MKDLTPILPPVHVHRNESKQINQIMNYDEQAPQIALHFPNDWHNGNEVEYSDAVEASQKIIRAFFEDKTKFIGNITRVIKEILSFDTYVSWGRSIVK